MNMEVNTMNKAKLVIFFTLLIFIAPNSYAEGCKSNFSLNTGCKGEEGYIYIPKDYRQESKISCKNPIFKGNSLPKVGSMVRPTSVLMFYKNLDEINSGYKKCSQSVKDFKGKEFLSKDRVSGKVKSIQEVDDCLMDICMSDFDKIEATGNEDILGWSNNFKIISYEQIKNDLFAKIKVTK